MVLLLSRADLHTLTKEEVMDALGLPPDASRTLGGITNSIGSAARAHLPRPYWLPFGISAGAYRRTYTLNEDIAEAVKKVTD
jgi:hypothetical protein